MGGRPVEAAVLERGRGIVVVVGGRLEVDELVSVLTILVVDQKDTVFRCWRCQSSRFLKPTREMKPSSESKHNYCLVVMVVLHYTDTTSSSNGCTPLHGQDVDKRH